MAKVLIADDEHSICQAFSQFITMEGHEAIIASSGEQALELTEQDLPDAVFLDIQMPGIDGLQTLNQLHTLHPQLPIIVMTAYGTVQTAMEAMRNGAFDYLGKPIELPQLRQCLKRALHKPESEPDNNHFAQSNKASEKPQLIGRSAAMQEVFKLMGLLTTNDLTVLLTGESGVGKELVARAIHVHSKNQNQPFIAVNCAAVPEQLLESEFFGHEKGAFTGADERRIGRFEAAGNGTLFLDEVGELPLHLQGKLLRVLQERCFERVGSVQSIALNARLITATNRNLENEVAQGRFREDLYHRLKLVTLEIPPLRKRKSDIEVLAVHFLQQANIELNKYVNSIEPQVLDTLRNYSWPGNIRELEHTIKRSVLMARSHTLTIHDLDLKAEQFPQTSVESTTDDGNYSQLRSELRSALQMALNNQDDLQDSEGVFHNLINMAEQELIEEALRITNGNQVAASKLLGLHRSTMRKKIPN
jgi:nitrogen regulation protein NR(I)